jgi:hypothetical protein
MCKHPMNKQKLLKKFHAADCQFFASTRVGFLFGDVTNNCLILFDLFCIQHTRLKPKINHLNVQVTLYFMPCRSLPLQHLFYVLSDVPIKCLLANLLLVDLLPKNFSSQIAY